MELEFFDWINQFMQENMTIFIVTCLFMLLDIIFGMIKGWVTHSFSSTVLRTGLGHKLAFIFVMCVVAILQVAMFDPNFQLDFDFPLFDIVCGFIIFMEFISIIENATILNPQLNDLVGKYFDKTKDDDDVNLDIELNKMSLFDK